MEHFDHQLAQRVWQRVQSKQPDTPEADIAFLLQEEVSDLSRYLQLQNTMSGSAKPLLTQLTQKTRRCISVLRGISFLLTDTAAEAKTFPLPKELPLSSVLRCYGATLQRLRLYEDRQRDPEYGPGFRILRTLSEERCALLLQLLGS